MELDALIGALAPGDVIGRRPVEILDLAYDSRRVADGTLFFCVPGARVDGSTVLDGAVIEAGAQVRDSLVGAGARIGARTVLDGAVIGDMARIGADNELRAGARVWCDAEIPASAIRFSSDQ